MTPPTSHVSRAESEIARPDAAPPEASAVRLQLGRLLASPHIRNSKRCHALLKYVVEASLAGAVDGLKERTLGCDVFHREPDYDSNQDSVVRTAAAEVRKRLAQYYLEPGHEREIRIALPSGSYVPEFCAPAFAPAAHQISPRHGRRLLLWVSAAAVLVALVLATAWLLPGIRTTPLDSFWAPLLQDRAEIVICVGQPSKVYWFDGPRSDELNDMMVGSGAAAPVSDGVRKRTPITLYDLKPVGSRYFIFGDLMVSVRLGELLGRKEKAFRVLGERAATYKDLRGSPLVLVGLSNNRWTLQQMGRLRYYFDRHLETGRYEIRDRQAAGRAILSASPGESALEEYAIVSRVFDPSIEKAVITVAGLADRSTGSAGELLTNESYMRKAFATAPQGWSRKNIEIVLKANLVGGTAGPPTVVAEDFW